MYFNYCAIFAIILNLYFKEICTSSHDIYIDRKSPTVLVVLLARNKEHTLPYFLTIFEELHYPKDRLSLFIRSDHNEDRTNEIFKKWLAVNKRKYHSVDVILKDDSQANYNYEGSPTNWTIDRFNNIINFKEKALSKARHRWADYILYLDLDVFIIDRDLLNKLIKKQKPIVGPMLNSLGTYSNYWCGMTEDYWYTRTDEYLPILERKEKGCFSVPMVHSCILVDLRKKESDKLTFNAKLLPYYTGPNDDIIIFAIAAKTYKMEMFVCNEEKFGYIPPPLSAEEKISRDYQQIADIKLEILVEYDPLPVSPLFLEYIPANPPKVKLNFDNIYMINLKRRPVRRKRMLQNFDILGIDAQIFDAFDGEKINSSYLQAMGIKQLIGYKDPWFKRDMTYGEIGCFLSHYFIWQDIVAKKYEKVMVFEDDLRFEPLFVSKVKYMMDEIKELNLNWDLVYLGRKQLEHSNETWVDGSEILVNVGYSYWTLAYIISLEGAKKLLKPNPLEKIIPVDEYLPIMFDKHPEVEWKNSFWPRNLNAFSVSPLFVYPAHYVGEEGYLSDTESSHSLNENEIKNKNLNTNGINNNNKVLKMNNEIKLNADVNINEMTKDEL